MNLNLLNKASEDKKTFIIDKYNSNIRNSVIEEDNEDEIENNENKKNNRFTNQFTQFNINNRRDVNKIV
jgi:hypothetical protein